MSNTLDNGTHGSPPLQASQHGDGISTKLRQLYRQLEQEAVPDNLLNLLEKLDRAEKASAAAAAKDKADD
jgi:hypothetical protein